MEIHQVGGSNVNKETKANWGDTIDAASVAVSPVAKKKILVDSKGRAGKNEGNKLIDQASARDRTDCLTYQLFNHFFIFHHLLNPLICSSNICLWAESCIQKS